MLVLYGVIMLVLNGATNVGVINDCVELGHACKC